MSLPIHQQSGLPRTWEVAGESFTVSGITYYQFGVLSAHLQNVIPHPVDQAKQELERLGDLIDTDDRKRIIMDAYQAAQDPFRWPPVFESQAGQRYYYGTPEGIAFFLHTILSKHHPDLTVDEVKRRIAPRVSIRDMEQLSMLVEIISEEEIAARKAKAAGVDVKAEQAADPMHTEANTVPDGDDDDPKAHTTESVE